jgi:raffinose/stachyose/melibiose transport system substrate-binding protein
MTRSSSIRRRRTAVAVVAAALLVFGLVPGGARPAGSDHVTLSYITTAQSQATYSVLVPNFERAYPNITLNVTYAPTVQVEYQLVMTELAAGNGPDLIPAGPGCGSPISLCVLAKDGYLAPLVKAPWVKRSPRILVSADKFGQGLFIFSSSVLFEGLYTNDDMFRKLGLQVPQTFQQLLALCGKARADGTIPLLLPAQGSTVVQHLLEDIALNTVYAGDKHWNTELKAGTVSFDATAGWHAAMQELVDMNSAGCFGPGPAGTTSVAADSEFAQGQALMYFNNDSHHGAIVAADPQFSFSHRPFPVVSTPGRSVVQIEPNGGPAVNARSSPQSQAAAQLFIDFRARPAQDALDVSVGGGVTPYQFLKGQLPAYLASFAPALAAHEYAVTPEEGWWNAGVAAALNTYGVGLITGQTTIDDVLNAMDAAWKQGPA